MSRIFKRALASAAVAAATFFTASASQANDATGIWIDHTGRGAVEIVNCGSNLCGRVVWLQDAANGEACGMQIIGNAKPVGGGRWDNGWIYDPDAGSRYSVEITPLGGGRLKVMGYSGSKFLSETMIWRRAPSNLKRCNSI
jgi:uncharacterized protein (DUF2147 family)